MAECRRQWRRFLRQWSWLAVKAAFGTTLLQAFALFSSCAVAQQSNIVPDNTLGAESSLVTPNIDILGIKSEQISGGASRGVNLFHSFREFNIKDGFGAYFTNPNGIENILSRVTGGNASEILGKLGVLGNANLFLINPSGIIFGKNASLDVKGSFVATTANAIKFGNLGFFDASVGNAPSALLTVNPSAFLFNQIANQPINSIQVNQTSLSVPNDKSLLLVGGDIKLNNGSLQVPGGRVELGGLLGEGTLGLNVDNILSLNFPNSVTRAEVSLINDSEVYVRAADGGSIAIAAQNFNMSGNSRLLAGIESGLGSINSQAGNIEINTTGAIRLTDLSLIANTIRPGASGNAGDIIINTDSLSLTTGAQLQSRTRGQGSAGNVTINASDTVSFDGVINNGSNSGITSRVESPETVGDAGDINITARSVSVTNGAGVQTSSFGKGSAGSVNINARDTVSFDGVSSDGRPSLAESNIETNAVGKGGSVNITTGNLSVRNGAILVTATYGKGNAGSININARDKVSFDRVGRNRGSTAAVSITQSRTGGNGGDINITTGSLSVTNGALLDASNIQGIGNAGNININARDKVSFDGTGSNGVSSTAFSSIEGRGAVGSSGDINITTGLLSLTNGAVLSAVTRVPQDGGDITINANTLEAINGGQVVTTSFSSGKAGNITVNVNDNVTLAGKDASYFERIARFGEVAVAAVGSASGLFANTSENPTGQGGDLNVTSKQIFVQDGAQISASTSGTGSGGTLSLNAPQFVKVTGTGSKVSAESYALGNAGSLTITTGELLVKDYAQVTASAPRAQAGKLEIKASNIRLEQFGELATVNGASSLQEENIAIRDFDLLLMLNNSKISAQALNRATGGNITINSPSGFIVTDKSENSDIVANAALGRGGRIDIQATGVYGFEKYERNRGEKYFSNISDINASSEAGAEFDGTININILDVDPNPGLINLPTEPSQAQVATGCQAVTGENQSRFVYTGRDGLPLNPRVSFSSDTPQVDWVTRNHNNSSNSPTARKNPNSPTQSPIVEATAWVKNTKGEIILTTDAPTGIPYSPWQTLNQFAITFGTLRERNSQFAIMFCNGDLDPNAKQATPLGMGN
jgi:filamentous hemagglutinin family protein